MVLGCSVIRFRRWWCRRGGRSTRSRRLARSPPLSGARYTIPDEALSVSNPAFVVELLLPFVESVLGQPDERSEVSGGQPAASPCVEDEDSLLGCEGVVVGLIFRADPGRGPRPASGGALDGWGVRGAGGGARVPDYDDSSASGLGTEFRRSSDMTNLSWRTTPPTERR